MSSEHKWFNDPAIKAELNKKIQKGNWYVVAANKPGKVTKLGYAGYYINYPHEKGEYVNPDKIPVTDLSEEEYLELEKLWLVEYERQQEILQQERRKTEQAAAELKEKQRLCQHENSEHICTAAAAGCDIYEDHCLDCGALLRVSWSTAYDRDPDDHIHDWDWWMRYCQKNYQYVPKKEDYVIITPK